MAKHSHHQCEHHSARGARATKLIAALAATGVFLVVEIAAALRANSLALLSDAAHNFTDGFALALSWYALWIAQRPASHTRTYGYHRVGILTALLNAVLLMVIAVLIAREAVLHLIHPGPVAGSIMMVVATLALLVNGAIALALRRDTRDDVNIRGAYLHMVGDALASVGVIVAGAAVYFTRWEFADPIISLLISAFIVYTSWGIVTETVNVLLEGTPAGLDAAVLADNLAAIPGVESVHDLHVWSIATGIHALSCHINISPAEAPRAAQVVHQAKEMAAERYGIAHSTIETECGGCSDPQLHCSMMPLNQ